jgi:hypothetical protein
MARFHRLARDNEHLPQTLICLHVLLQAVGLRSAGPTTNAGTFLTNDVIFCGKFVGGK